VEGEDTEWSAGVRRTFATGTDVELAATQTRAVSDRAPEQQEARLGLSVTQQLLRGFGPAVNLAAVRQAELGTLASAYELRGFTETLIAETESAYWECVLAQETIAIFNQSLDVAEQQRDEIEQRIAVGALAENDAAAARAEVARREQALIQARSQLEAARLRLLQRIYPEGLRDPVPEIRTHSQPRTQPEPITDTAERLALAEQMRPELNEARLRLAQRRLEVTVTRNGLLPRLDLFIALGKSGYAESFTDSFRELSEDSYDLTAGIELVHELGNRTGRARDRLAAAELEQAVLAVENLGDLVRLDVRLAVNEVERARKQIAASAVTRTFEEASLRAERERFDVGTGTALLVAQAQRDLLASQIAEIESIVTYRIALVNLYFAEGSLLERRGITVAHAAEPPR
jgi:outer membrane protein